MSRLRTFIRTIRGSMSRGSVRQWRRVGRGVDTHPGVVLLCWALKGFFFLFLSFFSPTVNTMVGSNVVENLRRGYRRHDSFLLYFSYH